VDLPGDVLRSRDLTLRGSAPGAFTLQQEAVDLPALVEAVSKLQGQKFKTVPLKDIEAARPDMKNRLVITFA
jgi:hypothetical protein